MSPARKRFYMILALVALVGGLLYRFAPSTEVLAPSEDVLFLEAREVAKYRARVQQGKSVGRALTELERRLARAERGLLKGSTPSLAAVELQNILTQIAGDLGIELQSTQVLRSYKKKQEGWYQEVPVQIRLNCNIAQLRGLLYRIFASKKYLKLDMVQIMAITRGKEEGMLSCTLKVTGLMKRPQEDGKKGSNQG